MANLVYAFPLLALMASLNAEQAAWRRPTERVDQTPAIEEHEECAEHLHPGLHTSIWWTWPCTSRPRSATGDEILLLLHCQTSSESLHVDLAE